MPTPNPIAESSNYDPRWFIWTIVFLVVTGVGLVTFIVVSDDGTRESGDFGTFRASARTTSTPTTYQVNK